MALALLIVSLIANQALVVGEQWAGALAPDPTAPLVAFAGLYGGRRSTALLAVALGWSRAVVMIEPAGLSVLAAWWAVGVVASQRESLDGRRWPSFVFASALAAAALAGADQLAEWLFDRSLLDAGQLVLGGVLVLPAARGVTRLGLAVRGDGRR